MHKLADAVLVLIMFDYSQVLDYESGRRRDSSGLGLSLYSHYTNLTFVRE